MLDIAAQYEPQQMAQPVVIIRNQNSWCHPIPCHVGLSPRNDV